MGSAVTDSLIRDKNFLSLNFVLAIDDSRKVTP